MSIEKFEIRKATSKSLDYIGNYNTTIDQLEEQMKEFLHYYRIFVSGKGLRVRSGGHSATATIIEPHEESKITDISLRGLRSRILYDHLYEDSIVFRRQGGKHGLAYWHFYINKNHNE